MALSRISSEILGFPCRNAMPLITELTLKYQTFLLIQKTDVIFYSQKTINLTYLLATLAHFKYFVCEFLSNIHFMMIFCKKKVLNK